MPKAFRLGVIGKRKVAVKPDKQIERSHPGRSIRPWAEIGELALMTVSGGESIADLRRSQAVVRTS